MCVMSSKKMAIAMFGQKRLSREGGIEIVVKELCTRMAKNGYTVTCYNRSGHHVSGAEYDKKTEYMKELIRNAFQPSKRKVLQLLAHHSLRHFIVHLENIMSYTFMPKDQPFFHGCRSC